MNAARRLRRIEKTSGIKEKICPICGTSFTPKTGAAN